MKLVTFIKNSDQNLGVKVQEGIIDVKSALEVYPNPDVAVHIMELIEGGEDALERFKAYIKTLPIENVDYIISEENLEWGPCITDPEKIICVGLNYQKHADETKASYPEVPVLFNKFKRSEERRVGKVCGLGTLVVRCRIYYMDTTERH